jgi:predicted phosphodiesterase
MRVSDAVAVITDIHGNLPALEDCGWAKRASLYERLAGAEEAGALVFGHTHKPWVHEYGGVLNCGSVGKPKDGDPRGAFAILRLVFAA